MSAQPVIEKGWMQILEQEFKAPYFIRLKEYLGLEKKKFSVYPPGKYIFNAYNRTPFDNVKVVILGQDPYTGPGQAHGLCFSVPEGIPFPPSLQNIFKEIKRDLGIASPNSGNLERWADQGVFLLNATLTVRANLPGSHQKQGWEIFTDASISALSREKEGLIFLLWGKSAQEKVSIIDQNKHYILTSSHPSPYSVNMGFNGCGHFSKVNELLKIQGKEPVAW